MTEKLSRKFGANLDPNKSLSTSAIDKALDDVVGVGAAVAIDGRRPPTKSHRYEDPCHYSTATLPSSNNRRVTATLANIAPVNGKQKSGKIEPEFVTKSANPPIESCLAKNGGGGGEAGGAAGVGQSVTVKVMTGQKLSLKIDESTRVQDVLTLTVRFLGRITFFFLSKFSYFLGAVKPLLLDMSACVSDPIGG